MDRKAPLPSTLESSIYILNSLLQQEASAIFLIFSLTLEHLWSLGSLAGSQVASCFKASEGSIELVEL